MKNLSCLSLMLTAILLVSCKKSNTPAAVQKGEMKATVHANMDPGNSNTTYSIKDKIKIQLLKKDGTLLSSLFANSDETVDFGQYEYADYTVTATAEEDYLWYDQNFNIHTGKQKDMTGSQNVTLDASVKNAVFSIQ